MTIPISIALLAIAAAAFLPVRTPAPRPAHDGPRARPAPSPAPSTMPADTPVASRPVHLLFIHHSVGGQLLADPGPVAAEERLSIHRLHPNGGGLRARLERAGFVVHEASYGSVLGERTDLFDWLPKFRERMTAILACAGQDATLTDARNEVVVFKSCYPNSAFRPDPPGGSRGDAAGPALTVANARATFMALREEFARWPRVTFVYLTAPPLPARSVSLPLWKHAARRLLGRTPPDVEQIQAAARARAFNDWLTAPDGWLADHPHRNVAVFDYFDLLTGGGASDFLAFATRGGRDAHPAAEGQRLAAAHLAPFIADAWRRTHTA